VVLPVEAVGRLAESVVAIATQAEGALLELMTKSLVKGIDGPGWASTQSTEVGKFRQAAQAVLGSYGLQANAATAQVLHKAAGLGVDAVADELAGYKDALGQLVQVKDSKAPGGAAVVHLAAEASGLIASSKSTVLRQVDDAYRRVVAEVTGNVLLGAETRRQVTQRALNRLAAQGVTGFIDKRGRNWDLVSYLEMATRTAAQRAMTAAHTEALESKGIGLVIVSDAPQECVRCRPYEGKVLSIDGTPKGTFSVPSRTRNTNTKVKVDGTLAGAVANGLYHPGCRHSHAAYIPGLTERPPEGSTADPEGDAARQRLRELERRVRRAKREELLAITPEAKAAAKRKVRAQQAAIRDHVDKTGIKRVTAREQLVRPQKIEAPKLTPEQARKLELDRKYKGQPAPEPPKAPAPPAKAAERVLDGWLAKVTARYDALDTGKAFSASFNYSYVQKVLDSQDRSALDYLLANKYVDQALHAEALELFREAEQAKERAQAVYEDALLAFKAAQARHKSDLADWREANGITVQLDGMAGALVHRSASEGRDWAFANFQIPPAGPKAALKKYTGSSYGPWNGALRAAEGDTSKLGIWEKDTLKADQGLTPLPESVIVHRGTGWGEFAFSDGNRSHSLPPPDPTSLIGTVQVQRGYMSTSVGNSAAFSGQPVLLVIRLPSGHPVTWAEAYTSHPGENELLLARDTTSFVHDVYKNPDGKWVVELEVLPADVDVATLEGHPALPIDPDAKLK
jgi:hypothetical protein